MFNLKVAVNNLEYNFGGATAQECLDKINLKFVEVKTKAILTLSKGEKSIDYFFTGKMLRLLIQIPNRKKHWAKVLEAHLEAGKSVV